MPIKVSIVEDQQATRDMLAALARGSEGFICDGAYANAETALKRLPTERPDVVLLDLELPCMSGVEFIAAATARQPGLRILVLTIHDDPVRIFTALEAGASGYLVKPVAPAKILEAITEIHNGGAPMSSQIARLVVKTFHHRGEARSELEVLTPREDEMLRLVAQGFHSSEIAGRLGISPRTVGTHLRNIYEKLHVHTRAHAVAKYLRQPPPPAV
ncbi:MAG: response regulator transcription factor [Verrucomicrobiae bacterium]|nr:response regulator transcription factor [Verrucomicrobiae bacterium]